ncbi:type III pantothenate kinase [Caproiciproducens galactitolivorans]|uniref:Type III pantothenate kinase n=1 Tax=Caproiciproducens galactitolivorans TaxID=642589 RepID=A0ABT4BV28_9FIRM|nr:type III pantothenate kinase [Caproiciproducens galactitolivorans]MCY1714757.1 type III pantothenate kinase [Caproiciproducens galactitolivorans]
MILALDIGNTNITIGVYDQTKLLFVSRMATDCSRMEDQYAIELRDILDMYGISLGDIEGAVISSVVPPLTNYILRAVRRLTKVNPICVGPDTKTNLKTSIKNPETTGADLVAGCVAAAEMFDAPCIVLDMGTATTFVVLSRDKTMLGGAIIPGVGISMDALTRRTAQLPSISLEAPENVIGKNTVDCMRSGILLGTACMIDGMIERMEEELGEKCEVVATGGLSPEIIPLCRRSIHFCDTLLLEGLRIIYEKNKE